MVQHIMLRLANVTGYPVITITNSGHQAIVSSRAVADVGAVQGRACAASLRHGLAARRVLCAVEDVAVRALRRVVLPAPLAPMSNVRLPGCKLTLMSRTTGAEPG